MLQRFTLSHSVEGDLVLEYFPEGWNDLKYTVSRSLVYHGFMRTYSGALRFVKDGKVYIDNILETYGPDAEISITIEELNQTTRVWETKVTGILNFDPSVYARRENYTELNFEDSIVHKKFKNRENLDIAYNRKESINETVLPGFTSESETVELRGQNTDVCNATCVYPFEAFNRLIQVICDLDYNPVVSSVFGRTDYGYVENGIASEVMVSKGLLMRGVDLAGNTVSSGETNLNLKLKELFENYNNCFNLGLGTEYDTDNQRWNFVIEEKSYFYQTTELFTLDEISDLVYEFEEDLLIQKISTGYRKFTDENTYGLAEYNNQSEFTTPISTNDKELNITCSYRADGLGFQIAIDNPYTGTEENDTEIDEDIFLVHAFDDSGTLRSVQDEDFDLVGGLYGANPIQANIYISPARNMTRWGDYIRSGLAFFESDKVRFNKSEKISDLRSQYVTETETIFENRDIDVLNLKTPRFSSKKIKFNAPLTRSQITTISGNPYGLVKFYDYIAKAYNYGWIKEVSTDRVDKDTTWELWEATNLDLVSNNLIYMNTNEILTMTGNNIIKVSA